MNDTTKAQSIMWEIAAYTKYASNLSLYGALWINTYFLSQKQIESTE